MFKRSFRSHEAQAARVDKSARVMKQRNASSSFRGAKAKLTKLQRSLTEHEWATLQSQQQPREASPIVTLTVGREGRMFAAHENVLRQSPFFEAACYGSPGSPEGGRRISLPNEEPEVFSSVLEYLYKGDYYPCLLHDKRRGTWKLEDEDHTPQTSPQLGGVANRAALYLDSIGADVLRDTVVYCAAERYGIEPLKKLALRKQGLQAGIDVATILRSAQYAYANTPDSDSRLRAHYLALIIRCRKTFKRSGTMQAEMEAGGSKLYFDLFVAMCNHLDDVIDVTNARSPRTV